MLSTEIPIIIHALPKWDSSYASTACTLAKKLSKNRLVFYVEHPFTSRDLLNAKLTKQIKRRKKFWNKAGAFYEKPFSNYSDFIAVYPKPVLPVNFLPASKIYNHLQQKNILNVWQQIDEALEVFEVKQFIYINSFAPTYGACYSKFESLLSIYHCVDNILGEKYIAKHGAKAEAQFAAQANLTISTSLPLQQKMEAYNPQSFYVGNAAEYSLFGRETGISPDDIKHIPEPKIIYTGNIGLRINYDLLYNAAITKTDYQFVFIGPINTREFKGDKFFKLKNVHHLGAKPLELLPEYLNSAQVCMIPFLANDLTKYIYPLKINEYLATGKPVVSSNFSNLDEFAAVLYTYNNLPEFIRALEIAIADDNEKLQKARKKMAAENTWENRVIQLEEIIEKALSHKSEPYATEKLD